MGGAKITCDRYEDNSVYLNYIPGAACAAEDAKLKENGLGDDDAAGWPNMAVAMRVLMINNGCYEYE